MNSMSDGKSTNDVARGVSLPSCDEQSAENLGKVAGQSDHPTRRASDREIWFEILAVLAIGVFPSLIGAIGELAQDSPARIPFWLDAFELIAESLCIACAVLYVIYRTGKPWSAFGLTRFRLSDVGIGASLVVADFTLWCCLAPLFRHDSASWISTYPRPQGIAENLLMVVMHITNGFAEEVVCRAYLITRLIRVLKSRLSAVVFSAALFASYHIYYGLGGSLLHVFLLGLLFGSVFVLLRRVWPLAVAHTLINVVIELSHPGV